MKNVVLVIYAIAFIALLAFSSCYNSNDISLIEKTTNKEIATKSNNESYLLENETTTQQTTATKKESVTDNDSGGGIIELRKYRVCYYNIPAPFAALVGRDACLEWELEYGKTHNVHLSERMLMVDFINHFNISKWDFEKANLEFAKNFGKEEKKTRNPQDYAHQEIYEVYNPDIIYTFDDDIINEYYLSHDYPFLYEHEYEQALEAGTYETRTTDWVDIEQMEAEINAKYGAPEVTETATALPEETEITE